MIGKIICDLAPTPQNNRNSEGSFITLKDRNILFAYTRYGNEGHVDHAAADIYACVSSDNGETFSEPYLIYDHKRLDAANIMSVTLRRMQNGDLGMLFLRKDTQGFCLPHFVRSTDEGKSWSEPVRCYSEDAYIVVNNDRMILLNDGRWLIPGAMHNIVYGTDEKGRKCVKSNAKGTLTVLQSSDDGESWQCVAKDIEIPTFKGCTTGVQEPGVVELSDGRLWCYIRNNSGRQFECFSSDGGATWTEPQQSWFTSPLSPMSVKRLRDGRLLAVWNPVPQYNGLDSKVKGVFIAGRTSLVLSTVADESQKFADIKTIENDPETGYCYTAIHETADGAVLLGYCAGSVEDGCCLNRLRIRKISLDEI